MHESVESNNLIFPTGNSINRVAYVCCGTRSFTPTRPQTPPPPSNARSKFPQPPTCGVTSGNKIYGGEVTSIDEHPWTAQLWYQKPGTTGSHCGGSLINERYVLTGKMCLVNLQEIYSNPLQ